MAIWRSLVLGAVLALPPAAGGCGAKQAGPPTTTVTIGAEVFTLEIAADSKSRELGLMNRESIADHGGMMFTFPRPAVQNFWMKDCLVDMDVAFLDATGRVTARHTMTRPRSKAPGESEEDYRRSLPLYSSHSPAQFAIEFKAKTLDRLNVHVGDKIPIELDRLKAMAR